MVLCDLIWYDIHGMTLWHDMLSILKYNNIIYRYLYPYPWICPTWRTSVSTSVYLNHTATLPWFRHQTQQIHDDVIKWKHFPRYWPFVRGIHRSPVNSPQKGQWRGALMFSFICPWIKSSVNIREAGDLKRYRAHYDVIVMSIGNVICLISVQVGTILQPTFSSQGDHQTN